MWKVFLIIVPQFSSQIVVNALETVTDKIHN